jgi:Calpain family cysteine protease
MFFVYVQEWSVAWSDTSKGYWTPAILAELQYTLCNDGTFWMSLQDFYRHFSRLEWCRLFSSDWYVSQAFGVFTATDDTNRHYKVELVAEQCSGKVVIALCQSDARVLAGCAKPYD